MRILRWTFILFQFVWLNIVTPGHIRGSVTLPAAGDTGAEHACCHGEKSKESESPTPDEQRRCAVCFFAAGLSLPPVFVFDHAPQGEVGRVAAAAPQQIVVRQHAPAFYGRAPPVA